jgi:hypothetical protein
MKMEIAKLRRLVCAMLARFEELGCDQEDVPWNRYWDTVGHRQENKPIPERYDAGFSSPCPKPRRGSLEDDWNDIKAIASGLPDMSVPSKAIAAVQGELYKLVQVSELLRAVGDYYVWKNPDLLNKIRKLNGDNTESQSGSAPR